MENASFLPLDVYLGVQPVHGSAVLTRWMLSGNNDGVLSEGGMRPPTLNTPSISRNALSFFRGLDFGTRTPFDRLLISSGNASL